jgi:D-alanyl-D-alanine carboxypeptidase
VAPAPKLATIYKSAGQRVVLPERMAHCTPDTKSALHAIGKAIADRGGQLFLSDLFRSYDMQLQAHLDFVSGRKKAFSPPPGGSLHEAGRALDLSLEDLNMTLKDFWPIAKSAGVVPIIDKPDAKLSEAWYFECRGSHQLVHDYYKSGKGTNFDKPYKAMAASAILAAGTPVDRFKGALDIAYVQSGLIRLGQAIGNMDGALGPRSRDALAQLGVPVDAEPSVLKTAVDRLLQAKFPTEFFDRTPAIEGLEH